MFLLTHWATNEVFSCEDDSTTHYRQVARAQHIDRPSEDLTVGKSSAEISSAASPSNSHKIIGSATDAGTVFQNSCDTMSIRDGTMVFRGDDRIRERDDCTYCIALHGDSDGIIHRNGITHAL